MALLCEADLISKEAKRREKTTPPTPVSADRRFSLTLVPHCKVSPLADITVATLLQISTYNLQSHQ